MFKENQKFMKFMFKENIVQPKSLCSKKILFKTNVYI